MKQLFIQAAPARLTYSGVVKNKETNSLRSVELPCSPDAIAEWAVENSIDEISILGKYKYTQGVKNQLERAINNYAHQFSYNLKIKVITQEC